MSARDLARQAIGEAAILEAAKELNDQTRRALFDLMQPGDRLQVDTLGMVYVTQPGESLRVVDREAFVRWVQANHPTSLVMVPTVVPSWERDLLKAGADKNGEVPDGCEMVPGRPALTVKPTAEAKAVALAQIRREVEA